MADNTNNRGGQDRQRIDVNQDYELRDWAEKFSVSQEELREAVKAVGTRASDVEEYLRGNRNS
jgi:predicted transcriptional regulator